jgi:hypothetical protein
MLGRFGGGEKLEPLPHILRRGVCISQILNLAQRGLDRLENSSLQRWMMPDQLVDSRADEDGVFLVEKNFHVSIRGEDGKDAGNDGGVLRELILPGWIQTEGTDCIRNRLDELFATRVNMSHRPKKVTDLARWFKTRFNGRVEHLRQPSFLNDSQRCGFVVHECRHDVDSWE